MKVKDDPVSVAKLDNLWRLQNKLTDLERSLVDENYVEPTATELLNLLSEVCSSWSLTV